MSIWQGPVNLEALNNFSANTLVSHLGIIMTNFGDNFLEASMPVDNRTVQPYRLLHGGASCVLAESLGSIAASLCIDTAEFMAVGQHIEATHIRSATKGVVRGKAVAIHIGRSSQIWRIEIFNDEGKMICDSKIIMAVVKRK
ncbi:MAG: hotdog fold thioesterase [Bacteriovorax sp.]|nr:hotdog fold thioesterase [Bacteriovorax sp.]